MRKFLLFVFALQLNSILLFAQSSLWINDPQRWYVGEGTIEEAELHIQPKGIYFEYNLFLTISGRDLGLIHQDTMEIIYNFELPPDAIVHDSWLWFNGEIIKGEIMDRWTASQVYEEIVDRRQDPSILVKNDYNNYELRIFPMAGDESRKVKLTFLLPANWSTTEVSTSVPIYLLKSSMYKLKSLELKTFLTKEWKNPKLKDLPEKEFTKYGYSEETDSLNLSLVQSDFQSSQYLTYKVDSPLKDGVYINAFEGSDENSYQLVYQPTIPQEQIKSKKNVILFDYESGKSNTQFTEVLAAVKSTLLQNYTEKDSFNLIFSNSTIKRISENWISADSSSIENIFKDINADIISNYSNLPSLMANGVEFVKSNNYGEIVLLANSDNFGEYEAANALIEDLLEMMEETIPIYIGDYLDKNANWYYYGNKNFRGNGYLYENLAKLTGGSFYFVDYNNPFKQMFDQLFGSLGPLVSTFDLHTTLEDGFCYARFNLNGESSQISINKPIIQVGKYFGEMPFKIEFNGIVDGNPFYGNKSIESENIITSDSITSVIWTGKYISNLEDDYSYYYYLTNQEVYEIIDLSVEKKVLSKFTAFLCLEPGMSVGDYIDIADRNDGGWFTDVDDDEKVDNSDTLFSSYPNPFNNQTTIKIRLSNNISPETASFKIYNILGQVVKSFNARDIGMETNEFEFNWDGRNDHNETVASGNYFFVMNFGNKVKTLKLILLK